MRISDWSSDVCSSDLPWLESSRIGGDPCLRARDHVVLGCGQLVHKPFAQGLRGRKAAAFGEERQRLHETEHAHRANDAPAARQAAQAPLGKSELALGIEIGRAPCRERVCQYVQSSVGAVPYKKKKVK